MVHAEISHVEEPKQSKKASAGESINETASETVEVLATRKKRTSYLPMAAIRWADGLHTGKRTTIEISDDEEYSDGSNASDSAISTDMDDTSTPALKQVQQNKKGENSRKDGKASSKYY